MATVTSVRNSDLPRHQAGTPTSVSGFVTVTPGSSLAVNEDALKNNTGLPIEVREIKFAFTIGAPAGAFEAMIGVKTVKGDTKAITQTPIPISLLGIRRSMMSESLVNDSIAIEFSKAFIGQAVWRIDTPLYLMPGESLQITIGHRGLIPNSTFVIVTMSGTVVQRAPSKRYLPYVAAYIGQQIDFSASLTVPGQSSTEKHLVNALKIPVRIMRFTGRLPAIKNNLFTEAGGWSETPDGVENLVAITMRSSNGVPTVRFATPFGRVFEQISASWECQHTLPPGGYYLVNFPLITSPNLVNVQFLPMIAMHGVREDQS
jgi:hypothetical protein